MLDETHRVLRWFDCVFRHRQVFIPIGLGLPKRCILARIPCPQVRTTYDKQRRETSTIFGTNSVRQQGAFLIRAESMKADVPGGASIWKRKGPNIKNIRAESLPPKQPSSAQRWLSISWRLRK